MKPANLLLACVIVLSSPTLLLACGGCTDVVLLMTLPCAGFGILFVWLWIFVMLAARRRLRKSDASRATSLVWGSTLVIFALLGSAGYVVLAFLTMGSLLLPSLFIGFVWAAYLVVRFLVDVVRMFCIGGASVRMPLLIHGVFILIVGGTIAYSQLKANTLEHCVGCLGYGRHTQLFSKIMPRIVADGQKAVEPLIRATNNALCNKDGYTRTNTAIHATFCLACIGGPEAEKYLSGLIKQHAIPSDYHDLKWYKGACFAYARCAGPRAADDLVALFENSSPRDEHVFLLVALAMTGSKRGIEYVLDHMDLLLRRMESGGDGSEMQVAQATAEGLVFEDNPEVLTKIPAYRDCVMMGAIWLAEPRPNDYNSEFFWTESSENRLRPTKDIAEAWQKDSVSIKKRWTDKFE